MSGAAASTDDRETETTTTIGNGVQTLLVILVLIAILYAIFNLVGRHTAAMHSGYKLIVPLLARFGSSSSLDSSAASGDTLISRTVGSGGGGRSRSYKHLLARPSTSEGEAADEFLYLSSRQLDAHSLGLCNLIESLHDRRSSSGSYISKPSRVGLSRTSLSSTASTQPDRDRDGGRGSNRSVSYCGSEISVFIAPSAATVAVNRQRDNRPSVTCRSVRPSLAFTQPPLPHHLHHHHSTTLAASTIAPSRPRAAVFAPPASSSYHDFDEKFEPPLDRRHMAPPPLPLLYSGQHVAANSDCRNLRRPTIPLPSYAAVTTAPPSSQYDERRVFAPAANFYTIASPASSSSSGSSSAESSPRPHWRRASQSTSRPPTIDCRHNEPPIRETVA